jgi:mxaJ protein
LALGSVLAMLAGAPAQAGTLKVCADPDYLPFSNRAGQGFENEVAQALAKHLGDDVEYTWWSYRGHGGFEEFLARTLDAHRCDLVMDLPYGSGQALTTSPYYVSSYVFVFQKARRYDISSMDSPILRRIKIGFEQDTPPEDGLKLRGLVERSVAFDVGEHQEQSPRQMLDSVRHGHVDVMITWEPAIGAFLRDYPDLQLVPVPNERALGSPERYSFPMSMAVRPDEHALAERVNAVIEAHGAELKAIVERHGVHLYRPRVGPNGPSEL